MENVLFMIRPNNIFETNQNYVEKLQFNFFVE